MLLWIILTLIVAIVVVVLTVPLVRRYDARPTGEGAARQVLVDQLADIDAQERAGTVNAVEAAALRVETKRRLLVESVGERPARPLGTGALGQIAVAVAVLVTLGGTLLYSRLGTPETSVVPPSVPASATVAAGGGDAAVTQLIATLESQLKANPADPEGWRMLGWSRYSLGQFAGAADAYSHAATLSPNRADLQSALGEALTLAANGTVTPAAKAAFDRAVATDAADARAVYFQGVAHDQAGDHAGAVDTWVNLLKLAPTGAPWAADVRRTLTQVAGQAGISLTGRLPTDTAAATVVPPPLGAPPPTIGALPQPSESQTAAVRAMAPDAQQAMIRQMVDGLAARLKTNPQDPDGWLRLIRARMVQGDTPAAVAAREAALAALTNSGQRAAITNGAKALGVPGA
jgi:cytochrome c-type biogenesis protein CcmH